MDITRYIAFGDRHLNNQYFFVVGPWQFALLATGLLLPAWVAGRYAGRRGVLWAFAVQALLIAAEHLRFVTRTPPDSDGGTDVLALSLNFSLIQLAIALFCAILAWSRARPAAN